MSDTEGSPEERLKTAFLALPICEPMEGGIPIKASIPGMVRSLLIARRIEWGPGLSDARAARLQKHVSGLLDLMGDAPALAELGWFPHFGAAETLEGGLRALADRLGRPRASNAVRVTGRPRKAAAGRIARMLAAYYWMLTGEQPTVRTDAETGRAYGPFPQLVAGAFNALAVKASPEAQARSAIKALKEEKVALADILLWIG
jgi:hypothetical protein